MEEEQGTLGGQLEEQSTGRRLLNALQERVEGLAHTPDLLVRVRLISDLRRQVMGLKIHGRTTSAIYLEIASDILERTLYLRDESRAPFEEMCHNIVAKAIAEVDNIGD